MSTIHTHRGHWDASTRSTPTLAFLEKYTAQVDTVDITGPSNKYYAPDAVFYNADGTVYRGGDVIWSWMAQLFGPFAKLHHEIKVIRRFAEDDAEWAWIEAETTFHLKSGAAVTVPRFLAFLVGKSANGEALQIREAKAWWDSGALAKGMKK